MNGPVPIGLSEAASSPPSAVAFGGKIAADTLAIFFRKIGSGFSVTIRIVWSSRWSIRATAGERGLVGPVLLLAPLPAVLDRLAGERLPVVELDVLPEAEDVGRVVDDLPRLGQERLEVPLGVEPEERLHRREGDVQAVHLGAHVGVERVDVRRDADGERPPRGRRRLVRDEEAEAEREHRDQSDREPLHDSPPWAPLARRPRRGDVIRGGGTAAADDRDPARRHRRHGPYGAPGRRGPSRPPAIPRRTGRGADALTRSTGRPEYGGAQVPRTGCNPCPRALTFQIRPHQGGSDDGRQPRASVHSHAQAAARGAHARPPRVPADGDPPRHVRGGGLRVRRQGHGRAAPAGRRGPDAAEGRDPPPRHARAGPQEPAHLFTGSSGATPRARCSTT